MVWTKTSKSENNSRSWAELPERQLSLQVWDVLREAATHRLFNHRRSCFKNISTDLHFPFLSLMDELNSWSAHQVIKNDHSLFQWSFLSRTLFHLANPTLFGTTDGKDPPDITTGMRDLSSCTSCHTALMPPLFLILVTRTQPLCSHPCLLPTQGSLVRFPLALPPSLLLAGCGTKRATWKSTISRLLGG